MAEVSDDELAKLRAAEERAVKAEADAKARDEKFAALQREQSEQQEKLRRALTDPETVRQLAERAGVLRQPVPETNEDPDMPISRRDLEKAREAWRAQDEHASRERTEVVLRNQRSLHRSAAASRLSNFDKYKDEIDQYLDKLDPSVAAQPNAYDEVHAYVRSKHFDDEVAEAVARSQPVPESDDEETHTSYADRPVTGSLPAVPRRESPVVGSQASGRAMATPQTPKLSAQEKFYADKMGLSAEDWRAADDMRVGDFLGFNGREKV